MRRSVSESAVEQRTDQINNPGDDGDPMQLAQCTSDYIAGEVRVRQNVKRRRRKDEGKENQAADPADERQQHEKTKE